MAYAFDPELAPLVETLPATSLDDLAGARAGLLELIAPLNESIDMTGVVVTDHHAPGPEGGPDVLVRVYAPEGAAPAGGRPAMLDIHGGGFVVGSIDMEHGFAAQVARRLGAVVACVEYRLAPEHPFPAGVEDCYAALRWLHDAAGALGVDSGRIAVGGQSAGGGLTAATVLLARDRGGPPVCFQFLGIPELDHRLETTSMTTFVDTPMWHRDSAIKSWAMYLGPDHDGEVSPYASPSLATDLRGLPPTYLTTMEFDPLRDEGILYGLRLLEAGVSVELHSYPGTFHGSALVPFAAVSKRSGEGLLVALARGLGVTLADMAARRPNIVLVNCDDLGYGDLGCYGSTVNATPRLDRMAAEGLRLDAFYVASPVCSPSRGALLTGCYPPRIGFGSFDGLPVLFPGQGIGLAPTEVTIARLLLDAGYRTQMVGKWHCGDQPGFLPTDHGFEGYFGLPYSNDMGRQASGPPHHVAVDSYPPLPLLDGADVVEQQPDQATLTQRYVDVAVDFMRGHRDEPFFLYLAHMYVHLPIYVQERFADASINGRYGAAVTCIDWAAGELLDELAALGLDEDTLVLFTSDNGSRAQGEGGSNEPLRGTKATTWEGGQRVPCIARWPGRIDAGRTSDELVTALDLFPTLAAVAGAAVPDDRVVDGVDQQALLLDGGASACEELLYFWMDDLEAVRDRRWKLHLAKHGRPMRALYDLAADPGETTDVAAEHPEVVAALETRAEAGRRAVLEAGRRPAGRVAKPAPLTVHDPTHPYFAAAYDLPDRG